MIIHLAWSSYRSKIPGENHQHLKVHQDCWTELHGRPSQPIWSSTKGSPLGISLAVNYALIAILGLSMVHVPHSLQWGRWMLWLVMMKNRWCLHKFEPEHARCRVQWRIHNYAWIGRYYWHELRSKDSNGSFLIIHAPEKRERKTNPLDNDNGFHSLSGKRQLICARIEFWLSRLPPI